MAKLGRYFGEAATVIIGLGYALVNDLVNGAGIAGVLGLDRHWNTIIGFSFALLGMLAALLDQWHQRKTLESKLNDRDWREEKVRCARRVIRAMVNQGASLPMSDVPAWKTSVQDQLCKTFDETYPTEFGNAIRVRQPDEYRKVFGAELVMTRRRNQTAIELDRMLDYLKQLADSFAFEHLNPAWTPTTEEARP